MARKANTRDVYPYGLGSLGAAVEPNMQPQSVETLYKCSFCNKTFKSPQARGGHQNAHKKEIAMLRKNLEEEMSNKRAKQADNAFVAYHDVKQLPPSSDSFVAITSLEVDSES